MIVAADGKGDGIRFAKLLRGAPIAGPAASNDVSTCLMLYTSGTTGRPKGVPRCAPRRARGRRSRQVAQHQYRMGESSLGVMPMFHTMGVRMMLGSALRQRQARLPAGLFAGRTCCGWSRRSACRPLSGADHVPRHRCAHPALRRHDLGSLSRVGYAGMAMTPALVEQCLEVFKPDLFVNHYGSSEIYTFTICDHLDDKPGCAGRAGMNQMIRVVPADPSRRDEIDTDLPPGEPGEIVASMASPEAFTGYWKRPDADAKAIQGAVVPHRRSRPVRRGRRALRGRPRRRHDHQRRREHLSRRRSRTRWRAARLVASVRRGRRAGRAARQPRSSPSSSRPSAELTPEQLDDACLASGLARFKRPREYVFVKAIPRSASGKLLRRKLRIGEYERFENASPTRDRKKTHEQRITPTARVDPARPRRPALRRRRQAQDRLAHGSTGRRSTSCPIAAAARSTPSWRRSARTRTCASW